MVFVAMKPGVIIVDDVGNTLKARDLHPGRKPWQRFLLQPDDIMARAAHERAEALRVGAKETTCADRWSAVERADVVIVEERLYVEREALLFEHGQVLKKADAAARAEPFVSRQ